MYGSHRLCGPALLLLLLCTSGSPVLGAGPTSDEAEGSLAEARSLLETGRIEAAVEALARIVRERPEDAAATRLYGRALSAAGRHLQAVEVHRRAASFPANRPAATLDLARSHAHLGDVDAVLRVLDRAWQEGYRAIPALRDDPAFAAIIEEKRLDRFLTRLESLLVPFPDHVHVIHTFEGRAAREMFGWVGVDAGDLDGDGVHDAAIAAPFAARDGVPCGRVEFRSGATGALLHGVWGEEGDQFGTAVGAAGDIDGDGHADVIVGAPGDRRTETGRITVWSGRDGSLLLEREGGSPGDRYGAEARGIGDWNGDGTPDLLVGAPGVADEQGGGDAGTVELLSGSDLSVISTFRGRAGDRLGRAAFGTVDESGHYLVIGAGRAGPPERRGIAYLYRGENPALLATVTADETGGSLGEMFVSVVGDVDADGVLDFKVSDWRNRAHGKNSGRVYVHSGADGRRIRTWTGLTREGFGIGDGIAGDADGDGHDDVVVGAWLSSRGISDGGSVFLISGATSEVLQTWNGRTVGDHVGFDATGLGDVNGDGVRDYLITAASSTILGPDTGRAFVVSGPPYYRKGSAWDERPEDGDQRTADQPHDQDER